MTSTRPTRQSIRSGYGGHLFAVVLVAAWLGALAVSAPSSPESRPPGVSGVGQPAEVPAVSTTVPAPSSQQNDPAS